MADIKISFILVFSHKKCFTSTNAKSMLISLSCTSSIIKWVYLFIFVFSWTSSSKNIPVVLIIICDVLLLKQGFIPTWYPTKSPKFWFISYDSLFAMETAAKRLGWVIKILTSNFPLFIASSYIIFGTWVVLPHPVLPAITITWFCLIASIILSL